jgi:hypothetical protein
VNPDEEAKPIIETMSAADIGCHDLALVPLSQIPPEDHDERDEHEEMS